MGELIEQWVLPTQSFRPSLLRPLSSQKVSLPGVSQKTSFRATATHSVILCLGSVRRRLSVPLPLIQSFSAWGQSEDVFPRHCHSFSHSLPGVSQKTSFRTTTTHSVILCLGSVRRRLSVPRPLIQSFSAWGHSEDVFQCHGHSFSHSNFFPSRFINFMFFSLQILIQYTMARVINDKPDFYMEFEELIFVVS